MARSSSAPPTAWAFEALRAAQGAQVLIIDLRRVTMIDASGALMLHKLSRLLREQGVTLLLAHITATSKLGRALHGAGVFTQRHHADWFDDADRALEWAEQRLLAGRRPRCRSHELAIGEFALLQGLVGRASSQFVKPYLDRQLFPARAALYHDGQLGRSPVPARPRRGQHRGRGPRRAKASTGAS